MTVYVAMFALQTVFGLRHAGAIFGLMIVGWSIGGLVSIVLPLVTRPPAARTEPVRSAASAG